MLRMPEVGTDWVLLSETESIADSDGSYSYVAASASAPAASSAAGDDAVLLALSSPSVWPDFPPDYFTDLGNAHKR